MRYYWQFDLCALSVAMLVLIETFLRKDMKQRKNLWFLMLVFAIIVSSIADLPGIYMQNNPESFHLLTADLSTMVFLTVRKMLPWLYPCYVGAFLRLKLSVKKPIMFVVMLPELLMILCMLIEPTRRLVYYYVDGRTYHRGPLFNAFYFLTAYYVLIGIIMMLQYRKAIGSKEKVAFYAFTLLSLIPVVVQGYSPKLKWALFFQSLGLLGAYHTIDNEVAIRSPESGFYNRYALLNDAGQLFDIGISAYVMLIKVPSLHTVAFAVGRDAVRRISRDMGTFILQQLPTGWNLYEYGENQFAVIAYNASREQAESVVLCLKDRFSRNWEYESGSIQLSSEIMVGKVPDKAADLEQLVMVMDTPYVPEEAGAQVVYIDVPASQQYEARVLVALRNALREHRMKVFYQPIYDTALGVIHTAEALIRLNDPELGMVSPEYFIPLAEKNGLMKEIGDFVFEEVCRFMDQYCRADNGFRMIEVNLSAVQCVDQELPARWDGIMSKYHVDPHRLCLEITESAMVSSRFNMDAVTDALRERGFSFALDDYGTGYSNNSFIMNFPFEIIKIDKSILWGADKSEKADRLLHHIISMIHDLEMKVVVEGVETQAQREKLEKAGVEYLQGYLFSKPVPGEEALAVRA